ncbi:BREX-1 system phosphatase PglZ type A [Schleiferiaceae bacterium]|nr:BREX-1 system phosphatase PglZ type A [Schleiferiaceae bacterium]
MLQEKVLQYFRDNTHLKILFFFDPSSEYKEEFDKLELENIVKVVYENNPFGLKWRLVDELKESKVLLYFDQEEPISPEAQRGFHLMGLLRSNKVLLLDQVGEIVEKYNLRPHLRSLIQRYQSELKKKFVRTACERDLLSGNPTEAGLQQAIVSAYLDFKKKESWGVLMGRMIEYLDSSKQFSLEKAIKAIQLNEAETLVSRKIQEITGFQIGELNVQSISDLASTVLYNTLVQGLESVEGDPYKHRKIFTERDLSYFNQALVEIRQQKFADNFDAVLQSFSSRVVGSKLVEVYDVDAEFSAFTDDMVWSIIKGYAPLVQTDPSRLIVRFDSILINSSVNKKLHSILDYFIATARFFQVLEENASYILNTPDEYIEEYASRGYLVDKNFRHCIDAKLELDQSTFPKGFNIEEISALVNDAYENHQKDLNREWLKCLSEVDFDYSELSAPKQYDFYKTHIEPLDKKVVVIISDALRYEAAQELLNEMHTDVRNTADISYALASIPSKTNIGMAQLLPGEREYNDGDVLIEGISSSGVKNRSSILALAREGAKAVQFADAKELSQDDSRELFKSPVVYIYHDVIDATGDKAVSERRTFPAVKEALAELSRFIKRIHATFNVTSVYVTADHGFLYSDKKLEDRDKENIPGVDHVLTHNRYFLSKDKQDLEIGYSVPLSATTCFDDACFVNITASTNRYKKQGGIGHQFVHGGGSLQELVVPVIHSTRKRQDIAHKVTPTVLGNKQQLRVVANILRVDILQSEAVSRTHKERVLTLGLYTGNNVLASNMAELKLNSPSDSPKDRITRVEFILNSEHANEPFYKLKAFDKEDSLNALIDEMINNGTLIQPDF